MATNGFFGKVKEMFTGKADRKAATAHENHIARMPAKTTTPRGRSMTKGAFGGTGTGRGRRGMPGRKLVKKMIKAGWKAQNRVMPMTMGGK